MATLTISLPDSLKAFIDAQIATKGYGNVSEYFRSLLRAAQAKEEEARLEALLLEGLAANRLPLDAEFLKGIQVKTAKVLEKFETKAARADPADFQGILTKAGTLPPQEGDEIPQGWLDAPESGSEPAPRRRP
jgi:antitoxin ParD1/3/4